MLICFYPKSNDNIDKAKFDFVEFKVKYNAYGVFITGFGSGAFKILQYIA